MSIVILQLYHHLRIAGMDEKEISTKESTNITRSNPYAIPFAIIIAGVIIAAAVIYTGGIPGSTSRQAAVLEQAGGGGNAQNNQPAAPSANRLRPVSTQDHLIGNVNALVEMIVFTDLECPFCKVFHATVKKLSQEYGENLVIAYRQFPLESIHSRARLEAVASECAAKLGGNDAFWKYVDRLFAITPSNNGLDPARLPDIAAYVGLDTSAFELCLTSTEFNQKIGQDAQEAVASGGDGTPFSVVIAKDGTAIPVSGAQPYEIMTTVIDRASQ